MEHFKRIAESSIQRLLELGSRSSDFMLSSDGTGIFEHPAKHIVGLDHVDYPGQNSAVEAAGRIRRAWGEHKLPVKTKNFHWHMSGPHFQDYHPLLDEQATEFFGMTDEIAERARKIAGASLRSISDIARTSDFRTATRSAFRPR